MRTPLLLAATLLIACSIPVQAALIDRGNGMIYDDVLDITWLQDASMGGVMNWHESVAWADSLIFGGFDDWRLASMDLDGEFGLVNCYDATEVACRNNELGYMYWHNLMGSLGDNLTGDQGPFTGILDLQWSSTEYTPGSATAWCYSFNPGGHCQGNKNFAMGSAWAVRDGDVAVIPLPGAVWLLGSGLLGLAGLRRCRRRH